MGSEMCIRDSWLISATLGMTVTIPHLPYKTPRANMYVVLCSPPYYFRRSTLTGAAKYAYRKFYSHFLKAQNIQNVRELVNARFIEEFTVEGISDHIAGNPDVDDYVLYSTEFGMVLRRSKGQHLEGMLSILSKLYYGEPHLQTLSRRSGKKGRRYLREGIYTTMLAGMQDPSLYLDRLMLAQGFLRRLWFIPKKLSDLDVERYKDLLNPYRKMLWRDLDEFAEKLAQRRAIFSDLNQEALVMFREGTLEKINEIDRKLFFKAKANPNDPKVLYQGSYAEHLTKLAVIRALSDLKNEPRAGEQPVLHIFGHHLNWALKIVRANLKRQSEALEEVLTEKWVEPLQSSENIFDKILRLSKNGTKMSTLLKMSNLNKLKLKPYIETLFEREELWIVKHKTRGRPTVMVFSDGKKAEKYFQEMNRKGLETALYDAENYKEFLDTW